MTAPFAIEALCPDHARMGFRSGVEALDRYFREQVTQDLRRRVTSCYVAIEVDTGPVAGYYTLAAGGVLLAEMPEQIAKRLPRYPSVPGRLRAKKKEIVRMTPQARPGGPMKERLRLPEGNESTVEVIGEGAAAAPAVVELLTRLGVIGR